MLKKPFKHLNAQVTPTNSKKTPKNRNKGRKPKPENPTWICILKYSMWLYTCNRGKKWEDGKQRSRSHLANFVLLQILCYIFEVRLSEDSKKENKTVFFSQFSLPPLFSANVWLCNCMPSDCPHFHWSSMIFRKTSVKKAIMTYATPSFWPWIVELLE